MAQTLSQGLPAAYRHRMKICRDFHAKPGIAPGGLRGTFALCGRKARTAGAFVPRSADVPRYAGYRQIDRYNVNPWATHFFEKPL